MIDGSILHVYHSHLLCRYSDPSLTPPPWDVFSSYSLSSHVYRLIKFSPIKISRIMEVAVREIPNPLGSFLASLKKPSPKESLRFQFKSLPIEDQAYLSYGVYKAYGEGDLDPQYGEHAILTDPFILLRTFQHGKNLISARLEAPYRREVIERMEAEIDSLTGSETLYSPFISEKGLSKRPLDQIKEALLAQVNKLREENYSSHPEMEDLFYTLAEQGPLLKAWCVKDPSFFDLIQGVSEASKIDMIRIILNARGGVKFILENFEKFHIKNSDDRLDVAMRCVVHNPDSVVENFEKFQIENPMGRLLIAELCIDKGEILAVVENFEKFQIKSPFERSEIAWACLRTQYGPHTLVRNFNKFKIKDELDRLKYARKLIPVCAEMTLEHLEKFHIEHPPHCLEIARLFALHLASKGSIVDYFHKFNLKDPDDRLRFIRELATSEEGVQFIAENFERFEIKDPIFEKIFKYRHWKTRIFFIAKLLMYQRQEGYVERYDAMIKSLAPFQTAMVSLAAWAPSTDHPLIQSVLAHFRDIRLEYKQHTKPLEKIYLATIYSLENSGLTHEEKLALFHYCCSQISQDERVTAFNKLNTLSSSLCFSSGWAEGLERDLSNFDDYFQASLRSLICLTDPPDDFMEKFILLLAKQRNPGSLALYLAKMKTLGDPALERPIQELVTSLVDGTFQRRRYHTDHLQNIGSTHREVLDAWRDPSNHLQEDAVHKKETASFNFKEWLEMKLITDRHLTKASLTDHFPLLNEYLSTTRLPSDIDPNSFTGKCINMAEGGIPFNCTDLLASFQAEYAADCEFFHDLRGLASSPLDLMNEAVALITDDFEDLFNSGYEVSGSCQRFDGDPELTRCLLATCLDGKIKMVAIIDPRTKKIIARAILKILITAEKSPVLFFNRIYPSSSPYEDSLKRAAGKYAKLLGVPLYEIGSTTDLSSIGGSSAPYEYEDASREQLPIEGVYTIQGKLMELGVVA